MKRQYSITVRGKSGAEYAFTFLHTEGYAQEWADEGFDIREVYNSVPEWVASARLARPWCAAQDLWRWMRLW